MAGFDKATWLAGINLANTFIGAPNIEGAAQLVDERRGKRKKRGRASTLLTGPEGAGLPKTAAKTLLGE